MVDKRLFKTIEQYAHGSWFDKKCYLCGEYFKERDKLYIVVIASEFKEKYKKFRENIVVHKDEFDKIAVENSNNHELIMNHLIKVTTPHKNNSLTELQKASLDAFRKTAVQFGFLIETIKDDYIRRRVEGQSLTALYNIRTMQVSVVTRAKKGLEEQIVLSELRARIMHNMQAILGAEKYNIEKGKR